MTPGTDSLLFNQPLLEKVVSNIKEDLLISSTALLASLSKAALRGRSGAFWLRRLIFSRFFETQYFGLPEKICVAASINARVGVGAGFLPQTGAGVFGGRSHVPIQSQ